MRVKDLRKRLADHNGTSDVYVKIAFDFLDGNPELVADFDAVWNINGGLLLNVSVRQGDLTSNEDTTEDEPCDGCPLNRAPDFVFEHYDIDTLMYELCDRPENQYRCCFLPDPPSGTDQDDEDTCAWEGVDLPF